MNVDKHDLAQEFPELRETITELKTTSTHFVKLFDEYQDVTHEIYRIEQQDINVSDEVFETLKLKRVHLKDELYKMLIAHKHA